jgi:hypothetical protein
MRIRLLFAPVGRTEPKRSAEDDVSLVVVTYRYSTSSDRVPMKEATWRGHLPGRSLATVMTELRRLHRSATNIAVTRIVWRNEVGRDAGMRGLGAEAGRPRAHPPHRTVL